MCPCFEEYIDSILVFIYYASNFLFRVIIMQLSYLKEKSIRNVTLGSVFFFSSSLEIFDDNCLEKNKMNEILIVYLKD